MRIYVTKTFRRFQRREGIADAALVEAVDRADAGLIDADLGGGLIKQRVARPGQGKRGGFRTIVAYRRGNRGIFLFGFAKSERENLNQDELAQWQRIGRAYLGLDDEGLEAAIAADELMEVSYDSKDQRWIERQGALAVGNRRGHARAAQDRRSAGCRARKNDLTDAGP